MYPAERREKLISMLKQGFVSIHDLAIELDVSEVTIRRDLNMLHREGLIEKVTGGGQAIGSAVEPAFMKKRVLQQQEKEWIAQMALQLIEPHMTIGLSAGTTTWTLAKHIKGIRDLTFVTNSTNVALELKSNGYDDIHLTGGHFRTPSDALVGPLAEAAARSLHTDLLFIGAHGVDVSYGISTPNIHEAAINRVMMERTDKVVLLADSSKWGLQALTHIAAMDEIDVVITDADKTHSREMQELRDRGIEVLVVSQQKEG